MRSNVLFILVLLTGPVVGLSQSIPPLTGRVVDQANILLPETERMLGEVLRQHEEETSNQIAVLTIPSLDGESIESYSLRVANGWELGQTGSDNGVLVTVAVEDRRMRIEVGYGLEGQLTDALAGQIIRDEMRPRFRDGDFDAGVSAGVRSILGALDGTYVLQETSSSDRPGWILRFFFFGVWTLMPVLAVPTLLMEASKVRWVVLPILTIFPSIGGGFMTFSVVGGLIFGLAFVVLFVTADLYMSRSPKWIALREKVAANKKKGKSTTVRIGGIPFSVGGSSSSGGSSWSSGSSFSGGGGSFGGGGASGSW
jgi:uncharacterized protein